MSARDWTGLAFRLFAMYLIAIGILALPTALHSMFSMSPEFVDAAPSTFAGQITVWGVPLLVGAIILMNTNWFVDKAFASVLAMYGGSLPKDAPDAEPAATPEMEAGNVDGENEADEPWVLDLPRLHRDDVLAILVSIMGIWLIVSALPDAVKLVVLYFSDTSGRSDVDDPLGMFELFVMGGTASPVHVSVILGAGLYLFFNSYKVVRYWSKGQTRGPRRRITDPVEET